MRHLGQLFSQSSEQIKNQGKLQIQNTMVDLESNWQGASRQRYERLYQQWQADIDYLINLSESLGQRTQHCAQAFESADQ